MNAQEHIDPPGDAGTRPRRQHPQRIAREPAPNIPQYTATALQKQNDIFSRLSEQWSLRLFNVVKVSSASFYSLIVHPILEVLYGIEVSVIAALM